MRHTLIPNFPGLSIAAVGPHISYLQELHAGDVVAINTTLIEPKEKTIRSIHEMRSGESHETVALATRKSVHMDTQVRKFCAFPELLAAWAAAQFPNAVSRPETHSHAALCPSVNASSKIE